MCDSKEVLEYALSLSKKNVSTVTEIFNNEKFPVPVGFTDKDVNLNAPRLYSDTFFLNYIHQTTKSGFSLYTIALPNIARSDVRDFISGCIISLTELYNKVADVSLSKGVFIRPPYITVPHDVEFVESKGFFNGFLGHVRPLNALEITHLYSNIQSNALGKALIMGFSQVTTSDEIKKYFNRGKDIAAKHLEVLSSTLLKEDLPAPMTWDHDVMDSKESPFSEKLMLFHVNGLNALGVFNYGASLSGSQRHDIHVEYGSLIAEIGLYAEAGAKLMVKNHWLEQTPLSPDRNELTKV
ncbi:hypothetical protein ASG89_25815 [Paenibacillus sp. Soil766]|uniref:DUF3231 family protein n=1 Tax=Paenibacillus sp. Soil766 TaxID=1736404 RepID=UPI000710B121|nr:DUF3231 family protein [Paenibacillus sp. Soil766]KRF01778.1 hypothetical protein ASG89_25815 [Paenibacillus sp. Soil766]